MMRDNVGTLQFHSYSTYRHAMVLIVRAWIGDILLGYRRLFLLVSVKRAIGLLRCVGCVCVSALSAGSYLYIFPLGFFLIPRTQPLFSTLHPPSLAITTTIPRHHLIYPPFFSPLLFLPKTHSPTLLLALSRRLHIQPTMQGRARAWTSFLFFCFNSTLFGPVTAPHINFVLLTRVQ